MSSEEKKAKKVVVPEARPMTRRQWLAFKAAGVDPAFQETSEPTRMLRMQAEAYDWIISNVYDADALVEVPMNELNLLAEKTYFMTYGRAETEKN